MFLVDTNILVYAANQRSPQYARCQAFLDDCVNKVSAWFSTWPIFYEFLRVSTHPRAFASPLTAAQSWSFLEGLLKSPGITMLLPSDRHAEVVTQTIQEMPNLVGNRMHDLHTAVLMREHGIRRIYTRDTDFHRFPFLEPVDPTLS